MIYGENSWAAVVCTKKQYNSSWYLRDHVVQEYVGVKLQLVILTWLKWKEEPNKAVLKYILHASVFVQFPFCKTIILAMENLFWLWQKCGPAQRGRMTRMYR